MGVGGGGRTVTSQRELPCVSFCFLVIKSRFVLLLLNSVPQGPVLRLENGSTNGLLSPPSSFQRRAGQAGGVMVSQCISSAGYSHLHQDLPIVAEIPCTGAVCIYQCWLSMWLSRFLWIYEAFSGFFLC